MKGKRLAAALFAALNLLLFAGAYAVSVPIEVEFGQTEARTMLDMINAFRAGTRKDYPAGTAVSGFPWQRTEAGGIEVLEPRAALVYDAKLERIAMQRAAEIAVYYDHVLPDGTNLRDCHYFDDYSVYGENIAAGQESAEEVFKAWMETNDPYEKQGHRRNMLKEDFTAVGFGHVVYNGRHYWVQEFGSPASSETVPVPNDTRQPMIVEADLDFMGVTYPESEQTAYILNGGTLDLKTVVCVTRPITPGSENLQKMALPASYVSQDEDVVTVDENGIATAVGDGEAVVRVTADNEAYDVTVTLIVYTDFTSVEFGMTEQRWTYSEGETTKFFPVFTPEGSYGETWFKSEDTEVATVDDEGNVTFLKEGTVAIYLCYRHVGASEASGTGYTFTVVATPERQSITDAVVTPERSSYVYTGTPIEPAVTVTLNGATLTADDYDVAYADNMNAGTATITVTGKGNYKDAATGSFAIETRLITGAQVTTEQGSYTYTGSAIEPEVTVTLGGRTLTIDTDYEVSYGRNIDVGTALIMVTGKGNYHGTTPGSFTITAKPIAGAAVSVVSGQDLTYTGSAITPAITVTLGGAALTADDYDVAYADNTNAGTATITVTGKGNYKDAVTGSFTITAKSITDATVTPEQSSYVCTGDPIRPAVTVTLNGTVLTADDYDVAYADNTNAGTATITVTGKGNYTGTVTGTFEITEEPSNDIADAEITLSAKSMAFNTEERKPAVTVVLSGNTLTMDDYDVAYADNIHVGQAKVTVTGKGEYTGSQTVEFSITPWEIEEYHYRFDNENDFYYGVSDSTGHGIYGSYYTYYNGKTRKPLSGGTGRISVRRPTLVYPDYEDDDRNFYILEESRDYDLVYEDNKNAGTAKANLTFKGDFDGEDTITFEIRPLDLEEEGENRVPYCNIELDPAPNEDKQYCYTGQPISPEVKLIGYYWSRSNQTANGDIEHEIPETDYEVVISNNINIGEFSITIKPTQSGSLLNEWTWTYEIVSGPIAEISVQFEKESYTYTGGDIVPVITGVTATTEGGVELTLTDGDYDVAFSDNRNAGKGKATLTLKNGYEGTFTAEFTIAPLSLDGAYVTTPKILVKGWTRQQGIDIEEVLDDSHAKGGIYADDYAAYSGETEREGYAACTPLERGWTEPFHSEPSQVLMMTAPIYYHAEALEPEIWVRFGKGFDEAEQDAEAIDLAGALVQGTDYTVEYGSNENAGQATFRITGQGNYTGVRTGTFTITPASFNMDTGVWAKKETLTAGQEHDTQLAAVMNSLVVAVGEGVPLNPGDDYVIEADGSGGPVKFEEGQFRISLRGKGNYAASSPDTAYWSCGLLQPPFPENLPAEGGKLPEALVAVGDNAFAGTQLKALDLTGTVLTNLTESAFAGNENLKVIYLPATVASLTEMESIQMEAGVWLVFDGEPALSQKALDTLSYDRGVFWHIQGAD